ncbi:hypothetical protein GRI62_13040 [Erythrobacter arachoides]|uniref:ATP-binding protein n=1 Tax=Aurantiacibacter arachoides TaxID=1850444 RepID=A0A845A1U9_9SPHN|nr:hypothetical protein [Aurantiacibacter arachoides]
MDERRALRRYWQVWARPEQKPPPGDWSTWLVCAGRGFGKSRAGAEWVCQIAAADPDARIALVGASLAEARAVMVEGESGILACMRRRRRQVTFEPSLRRLTWSTGAQATLYSAGEPDSLRGPQHSHGQCTGPEGIHDQRGAGPTGYIDPSRYRGRGRCAARLSSRWRDMAGGSRAHGRVGGPRGPSCRQTGRQLGVCDPANRYARVRQGGGASRSLRRWLASRAGGCPAHGRSGR